MQYEPAAQSVTVLMPLTPEDYKKNHEIRSARLGLLVILSIEMLFALYYFIRETSSDTQYFDLFKENDGISQTNKIICLIMASVPAIYIYFFIYVVIKYRRIGILIFAWFTLIQLIVVPTTVIIWPIYVAISFTFTDYIKLAITDAVIYIILVFIYSLLQILAAVFSFRLAKLIKELTVHQIVANLNN